jgi:4-amino-4-deoxy-L-arabinose transferase-like glycosyltransferase
VGGLALALTPITVAISRHNNPDALLILRRVAAIRASVRGLEDGRARWLLIAAVCVGLGFETKMGVALMVVPGIAAAWLWADPRRRRIAPRQITIAGGVTAAVGLAWPILVWPTAAADRSWISGTSDNSIWSLILDYNGLGRVADQQGTTGGGGGGGVFGGNPGVLRLLNDSLGGQAGWLLGAAVLAAIALVFLTWLRRDDQRTGWVISVGGAFAVTALVFSTAKGIFHPYDMSLLPPFTATLVGATVGLALYHRRLARRVGAVALAGGAVTEIVVVHTSATDLAWMTPVLIGVPAVARVLLVLRRSARRRAVAAVVALLLVAPASWAVDTLGHATSGRFPAGGPATTGMAGGATGAGGSTRGTPLTARRSFPAHTAPAGASRIGGSAGGGTFGASSQSLDAAMSYVREHDGGTLIVSGKIRYVLADSTGGAGISDGRIGATGIMAWSSESAAR